MKSGQRVIKYLAIALAIFIIVSIMSVALFGFNTFSNFLGLKNKKDSKNNASIGIEKSEMIEKSYDNTRIANVKIELAYSKLTIKEGENFKVETNTDKVESKQSSDKLIIKENSSVLFSNVNDRYVTVTLPKDTILYSVEVEAGAGEIQIEKLQCKNLDLEMGAGKLTIEDIQVTNKAKIEGGAGAVTISSGEITNLDLDMGVGNFKITTLLSGNNKIDAGIGKLELSLTNGLDNYTIRAEKGIGSIKIDNKEVSSNVEYGLGETNIKINGGVGSIEVK